MKSLPGGEDLFEGEGWGLEEFAWLERLISPQLEELAGDMAGEAQGIRPQPQEEHPPPEDLQPTSPLLVDIPPLESPRLVRAKRCRDSLEVLAGSRDVGASRCVRSRNKSS
jgi:hypothetical protein